jgi:hypothetical protein
VDDVTLQPLGTLTVSANNTVLGTVSGEPEWRTNSFTFTANQALTTINLAGEDGGVLVDLIQLTYEDLQIEYLPEGFLTAFANESAYGEWTLELWDSRVGATNPAPTLLSWQLRLQFENTVPATAGLGHGIAVTNTVPPGGIITYYVPVPLWAAYATNTLIFATGPVDLLYNRFQAPTGANDGSTLLLTDSTGDVAVLTTTTSPALVPGTQYYLGVRNNTSSNITYALQVEFDVPILSNAVPVTDLVISDILPRYYRFDVTTNATAVAFLLTNLNGNANLYVRRGPPLPTSGSYDYASTAPGNDPEWVLVFPDSTPKPLAPGPWYLGVFNADTRPVRYTVVAIELTNAIPPIVALTNAIPYAQTGPSPGPVTQYYRFNVPNGSRRAQFEISQPAGPLLLAVQRGFPPLPGLSNFNYLVEGTDTNSAWLTLFDYSQPVNLSPGPWFLAVINTNAGAIPYTITATAWNIRATNIVTAVTSLDNQSLCLAWNTLPGVYYVVQGRTNLNTPGWTDVSPVLAATNVVTTWCVPLPSPYHFFRIAEATTSGSAGSAPMAPLIGSVLATPGAITLRWTAPAGERFTVEWSFQPPGRNDGTGCRAKSLRRTVTINSPTTALKPAAWVRGGFIASCASPEPARLTVKASSGARVARLGQLGSTTRAGTAALLRLSPRVARTAGFPDAPRARAGATSRAQCPSYAAARGADFRLAPRPALTEEALARQAATAPSRGRE